MRVIRLCAAALGALLLAGCASSAPSSTTSVPVAAAGTVTAGVQLPPVHGRFSYQIGGGYAVPAGSTIVDRDHTEAPPAGGYSICYVNAYQAQPDAVAWWTAHHPDLLLRTSSGALVIDRDWDEPLFDISTAGRRTELLGVVGGWLDGCRKSGYRAVEADNLDSYTRSGGRLTAAQALDFGRQLARRAHADRLALGQKNSADQSVAARAVGFDFAIAEECQVYSECDSYTDVYGPRLIEIEYTDGAFSHACTARGGQVSVVRRDRDVLPAAATGHVERWC